MKILALACIHNDIEGMLTLLDKISSVKFDVVVCPGDFTDLTLPKGFTRVDVCKLILEEIKNMNKPLVAVPGSWDKELIDFLDKENVSVHGQALVYDNVAFYGYGGARTPFGTPFEPNDSEIEAGLRVAHKAVENVEIKVQVTHAPPANTKIDVIFSGAHVGSDAVRKIIQEFRPAVAISAHIHEAKGVDSLGTTTIVNPGRFPEGSCALITLEKDFVNAEVMSLT